MQARRAYSNLGPIPIAAPWEAQPRYEIHRVASTSSHLFVVPPVPVSLVSAARWLFDAVFLAELVSLDALVLRFHAGIFDCFATIYQGPVWLL